MAIFCICAHMEPKFEEPMEQAQVEDFTNLELDQGKPRYI
jgi:hypothetical protein